MLQPFLLTRFPRYPRNNYVYPPYLSPLRLPLPPLPAGRETLPGRVDRAVYYRDFGDTEMVLKAKELLPGDTVLMHGGTLPGTVISVNTKGDITARWVRECVFTFKKGELKKT